MQRVLRSFFGLALVAIVGFGALTILSSPATAVPACPPPDGPLTNIFCGGIGNIPCPGNLVCVDDPRDNCCPEAGGADCGGVCVPKKKE